MSRVRMVMTLAAASAALVASAGCSPGTAQTPPSTPSPSTAAALPHSGAPKVEHPLPTSVLSGDPCQEALNPDQLHQILGTVPQGKPKNTEGLGPSCDWQADASVTVIYETEQHEGLSAVYELTKPQAKVWNVRQPIQGFPAVGHSTYDSGTSNGFCQVSVGISDELEFDTSVFLSDRQLGKSDPCDVAARIADMVVTNLRHKAGA
ncbi:DUF3558 domain-containing protein [Amycolatopsis rhabdoformis]|uniref:DUF3558 domain-containing protein n=1 Tax=Amycolatopsis rhabdoformis TaxID=1448059 RepID=A0ABZ1I4K7_9PSEU|nr:DUF3558 domain-containing protein [Amycolatopsis rhabdoformis]WSE28691.1 DUF3558 domain-containing protein [Amycolatopsis rhabdoformis]